MIKSKEDYKYYVAEDRKRYRLRFIDRFIFNENYYLFKYLKNLRRLEYLTNKKQKNIFQKIEYAFVFWQYKRLSFKYRLKIGINTCGPGLFLPHMGLIRIGTFAKVGARCTIGPNVVIGTKDKFENIATIGDDVEICLGVKIIGKVTIGNHAVIAPNSVVIKDVPKGCVVSGVPAVIIKKKNI